MKSILLSAVLALAFLVSASEGELVKIHPCDEDDVKNCAIDEVRISPCKEALKEPPLPCKFKKSKNVSMEIDFTPGFSTQKLSAHMYWANGIADLPFVGMDKEACKTTLCPTEAGVKQMYTYHLKIASYFPPSSYDVKFIFKGDDETKQQCCFIYKIKILK